MPEPRIVAMGGAPDETLLDYVLGHAPGKRLLYVPTAGMEDPARTRLHPERRRRPRARRRRRRRRGPPARRDRAPRGRDLARGSRRVPRRARGRTRAPDKAVGLGRKRTAPVGAA